MVAPMVIEGAMTAEMFLAYVENCYHSPGLPSAHLKPAERATNMKQLSTEQRLTRLIELDEIDREIAVLLGDAPVPGRTRSSQRVMRSGNSQTVSQSERRGEPDCRSQWLRLIGEHAAVALLAERSRDGLTRRPV
jgi:hypothetical protein